jgi:hypothetical protein
LGNLAAFRSPLGDRALYQTLARRNDAAKGCGGGMPQDASQKYFTIHCERRIFLATSAAFSRIVLNPKG